MKKTQKERLHIENSAKILLSAEIFIYYSGVCSFLYALINNKAKLKL